ncbi:glycoside hydrolase 43 family protein [Mangrovibacterium sp.]|uniref:glycoside hydrolase family 43 protein n=1 Tax=Mangrovibacterium sp. TaxID=1961364 RepID=UPI00356A6488
MKSLIPILLLQLVFVLFVNAQQWTPDLGDGTFKNPIIFADYSDPDILRVGDDFYMVASSFNCMPGIPVLHSKDLVNWEIINHVYQKLPLQKYDKVAHGEGCWAPSIRHHNGKFYVFFCTPNDGLFMACTDHPSHEWELTHVVNVVNWEDPCPIWTEDGDAYLVRSKLCGNDLYLHKMSPDGKKLLDNGTLIFRDKADQPIIEGPKFYVKDDFFYILAPAGGVPTGWQTALRSKNIYGPYETKKVLHQGSTDINGPHQGGLVELNSGEWWFAHFQDRGLYGRIVHLNPVKWEDGWPLMGEDVNADGIGEPVLVCNKPNVGKSVPQKIPQTSDEFESEKLGLQWQWHANPLENWYSLSQNPGSIRLNAVQNLTQYGDLWHVPNLLLQKFPAPSFTATTKVGFNGELTGDRCGLVVMGREWAYIALENDDNRVKVVMYKGKYNKCDGGTNEIESIPVEAESLFLRVSVNDQGMCRFQYSLDNDTFQGIGTEFQASVGVWIGAKVGVFCLNPNMSQSSGYACFDWFRVE